MRSTDFVGWVEAPDAAQRPATPSSAETHHTTVRPAPHKCAYAESHRGICLGFDVAPTAEMRKVRYVENRIPPNLRAMKSIGEAAVEHMLDLLTLKFKHWEYEQEHRLFVRLNDKDEESGLYFFDFGSSDQLRLREVIVGAQSQISPEQVAEALGNLAPEVATAP